MSDLSLSASGSITSSFGAAGTAVFILTGTLTSSYDYTLTVPTLAATGSSGDAYYDTYVTFGGNGSAYQIQAIRNIAFSGDLFITESGSLTGALQPGQFQIGAVARHHDGTGSASYGITLSLTPSEAHWKSAIGGSFGDDTKWDTGAVPSGGKTAVFDAAKVGIGAYTVDLDMARTVSGLTVGAKDHLTLDLQSFLLDSQYGVRIARSPGDDAALSISNGTLQSHSHVVIGSLDNAKAAISVGPGGNLIADPANGSAIQVSAGNGGQASFEVTTGRARAAMLDVGAHGVATSGSDVTVGSLALTAASHLALNQLQVHDGGFLETTFGTIDGTSTEIQPLATVHGKASQWHVDQSAVLPVDKEPLLIGKTGKGTLDIRDGGLVFVENTSSTVGRNSGSSGFVTVSGADGQGKPATFHNTAPLYIGDEGTGQVTVENGGLIKAGEIVLGRNTGSSGTLTIDGPNAKAFLVQGSEDVVVAQNGGGTLAIKNGGALNFESAALGFGGVRIGTAGNGVGAATVGGFASDGVTPSRISSTYLGITMGGATGGKGTLTVESGGQVTAYYAALAIDAAAPAPGVKSATVLLSGGSMEFTGASGGNDPQTDYISQAAGLAIGQNVQLRIENGGKLKSTTTGFHGHLVSSSAIMEVSGANSKFETKYLFFGANSGPLLKISDHAAVEVTEEMQAAGVSHIQILSGATFTTKNTAYVGAPLFDADGLAALGNDVLVTGADSQWTADKIELGQASGPPGAALLEINDGAKVVVNKIVVNATGSVIGNGGHLVSTNLPINNGGYIKPGLSPGTLTIDGDYVQTATGHLGIEIAGLASELMDHLIVHGNVELGGTLDLKFLNGFAPQLGDHFEFLQVDGGRTGSFANIELPVMPGPTAFQLDSSDPTKIALKMVTPQVITWMVATPSGSWSNPSNWSGNAIPTTNSDALLTNPSPGDKVAMVDTNMTVHAVQIGGTSGSMTVIVPGGKRLLATDRIVVENGGQLDLLQGSIVSSAIELRGGTLRGAGQTATPVVVDQGTIDVPDPMQSLTLDGPITIASGTQLTKTGAGELNIVGPLSGGNMRAISGTTIAPAMVLTSLSIQGPDSVFRLRPNGGTSVLNSLSISGGSMPTGKLDITNNDVIVDYPAAGPNPAADTRQQIIAGRGGTGLGKPWNGAGITSSTAQADVAASPNSRSIGYAVNADLPLGALTTFRGQAVDPSSVLIRYTRTADANLDGVVNDDDVTVVGTFYAPGVAKPEWAKGDFDYNGFVDDDDVTLLGVFYNPAAPIPAPAGSGSAGVAAVPEPTTLTLAALLTVILVTSSRRIRQRRLATSAI